MYLRMTSAEKEAAVVDRKLNPRQDTAGSLLFPGRLSSGVDSSSDGEGVTSAPSAVDGVPSPAKKGGKGGKADAPVTKKEEKGDASFLFSGSTLFVLYLQFKFPIEIGAYAPLFPELVGR